MPSVEFFSRLLIVCLSATAATIGISPSSPYSISFISEGAQIRAIPLVPCAQAMTGHPPTGAEPAGIRTTPEVASFVPFSARE